MTESSFGVVIAPKRRDRVVTGPMALAALVLAAGAATRLAGLDHQGISFCYFKALTGYACFTCGTTRALGHLARFDLPAALAVQPLVTAATLALLLWGAIDGALIPAAKRTRVLLDGRALRAATILIVGLATLNWFYLLATGV